MSRELLTISMTMLKPRNDIEHSLSYEGGYSNAVIALRDALLFCSINNF